MNINLNSPAYFSKEYGVDDDVYWMCRELCNFVKDKSYSQLIDTIGIVPIVAPKELLDKGLWKEDLEYDLKYKLVYISKHIDFNQYLSANLELRKKLIVKNILESVKAIKKKGKFDYEAFKSDILNFLNYTDDDINY